MFLNRYIHGVDRLLVRRAQEDGCHYFHSDSLGESFIEFIYDKSILIRTVYLLEFSQSFDAILYYIFLEIGHDFVSDKVRL